MAFATTFLSPIWLPLNIWIEKKIGEDSKILNGYEGEVFKRNLAEFFLLSDNKILQGIRDDA